MHNRSVRFIFCALLLFALAVAIGVAIKAHAANTDNNIVGTWTTTFPPTATTSAARLFLRIRPDGSYTMYSASIGAFSSAQGQYEGTYASAGTFTVTPPNHWRLVAKTTSYADAGTYRLEGRKYLYLTGKLGTGKWTRVTRPPYMPQRMISEQLVPADIPLLVQATVFEARKRWRPDAIPIGLDVRDGNPVVGNPMPHYGIPYLMVTVTVYSPSAHSAWEVMVSPFSFLAIRDSNLVSTYPLPAKFADLPQVIATARQHGMRGPFKDADMEDYRQWGSVWEVDSGLPGSSTTGSFQVRASGAYLPASTGLGPVGFTQATHKAELRSWNMAIANFRAMLSQAAHRPSGRHCVGGLPGPGGSCVILPWVGPGEIP